jgi:hypothetical protein
MPSDCFYKPFRLTLRLFRIVSGESTKMNPPVYLLIHLQRGHGLYEDQRLIFLVVTRPADFP